MTPNPYSRVRRTFWLMLLIPVLILTGSLMGAMIPNGVQRAVDPPVHKVHLIAGPIHYDFLLPLTPETRAAFAVAGAIDEKKALATTVQERLWAIGASGHLGQFFVPVPIGPMSKV